MILKDSLAQTFVLNSPRFITAVDLYFSQIDPNDNILVEIRNTVNGFPGDDVLVTSKLLDITKYQGYTHLGIFYPGVNQSQIANLTLNAVANPLKISFDVPVKLDSNVFYSIVISSISKNTRLWISRIGYKEILTQRVVETNIKKGSCFTSQNGLTWTAQQTDDIKYNLYGARFKSTAGSISFKASPRIEKPIEADYPFESESSTSFLRVFSKNHSLKIGDKATIFLNPNTASIVLKIDTGKTNVFANQIITTATGSGYVNKIDLSDSVNKFYKAQVKIISGYFLDNQAFTTNAASNIISTNLSFYIGVGQVINPITTGTITKGYDIPSTLLNGFTLEKLNKQHTVVNVDSVDSFIINIGINANKTSKFGNDLEVSVLTNFKYDIINPMLEFNSNGSDCNWSISGKYFGNQGSYNEPTAGTTYSKSRLEDNGNYYLTYPLVNYSALNSQSDSLNLTCNISTNNIYNTPIININSTKLGLVSNRINNDNLIMNTAPNATNRFVAETNASLGSGIYKYVSKLISLEQPAIDLRIIVEVYKDFESDYKIYYKKISTAEDVQIDSKAWTELTGFTKKNSADPTDLHELDFTTSNTSISGWTATPFSGFKIKIVGSAINSCKAPVFSNLRIIALT